MVVSPAASATWWPGAASASGGAIATDAAASFGVAVTVVSATAWSASAAKDFLSGSKPKSTPDSASLLSVASEPGGAGSRATATV